MADRVLLAEALYEQEEFEAISLDLSDAQGCRFLDCRFGSLTLTGGLAERTTWRGSLLRSVRFTAVGMARSNWLDTRFEASAMSGCELFDSQLRRVHFEGCLLDSVNLRGATLREVSFDDCVLRHLDLGSAKLTDVTIRGCTVERLDLTAATLTRVDLRGSTIDLAGGVDRLRGAVVDHTQLLDLAPALAAQLGLQVRPLDDARP